jgi:hypothetical protein
VIKICPACKSTWAGGTACEDCAGPLVDPFGEGAEKLPEDVWKYIRLQYGARRGMIVRVLAFLLGPVVTFVLLRHAVTWSWPWSLVGAVGALAAGALTFAAIYVFAGKAVRVWVLRRGRLNKGRLARAMLKRALS